MLMHAPAKQRCQLENSFKYEVQLAPSLAKCLMWPANGIWMIRAEAGNVVAGCVLVVGENFALHKGKHSWIV